MRWGHSVRGVGTTESPQEPPIEPVKVEPLADDQKEVSGTSKLVGVPASDESGDWYRSAYPIDQGLAA